MVTLQDNYLNVFEGIRNRYRGSALYNDGDWNYWSQKGELESYATYLQQQSKMPSLSFLENKYHWSRMSPEYRKLMFYKELQADRTEVKPRKIYEYDDEGNESSKEVEMTEYDYYGRIIDDWVKYEDAAIQREIIYNTRQENGSFWKDAELMGARMGVGVSKAIFNLVNLISSIGTATATALVEGGNWLEAFRKDMADDSLLMFGTGFDEMVQGFYQYEYDNARYIDIDGNYTELGRWLSGASESIGQMLPAILVGAAAGSAAGSAAAASSAAVTQGVQQSVYYASMFSGAMNEKFKDSTYANSKTVTIIGEAALSTALDFAVEKVSGKLFGPSTQDMLVLGMVGSKADTFVEQFVQDALTEGIEEVVQETTAWMSSNLMYMVTHDDVFKSELTWQQLADAFMTAVISSAAITSVNASVNAVRKNLALRPEFKKLLSLDEEYSSLKGIDKIKRRSNIYKTVEFIAEASNAIHALLEKSKTDPETRQWSSKNNEDIIGLMTQTYKSFSALTKTFNNISPDRLVRVFSYMSAMEALATKVIDPETREQFKYRYQVEETFRKGLEHFKKLAKAKQENGPAVINNNETSGNIVDYAKDGEFVNGTNSEVAKNTATRAKENGVEVFVTDTNDIDFVDGMLFVGQVIANKQTYEDLLQAAARSKLVRDVLKELPKNLTDTLLKTFQSIVGKAYANKTKMVTALLFDSNFLSIALHCNEREIVNVLSRIPDLVATVGENDKAIKVEYEALLREITENSRKALRMYYADNTSPSAYYQDLSILTAEDKKYIAKVRFLYDEVYAKVKAGQNVPKEYIPLLKSRINGMTIELDLKNAYLQKLENGSAGDQLLVLNKIDAFYDNIFQGKYNDKVLLSSKTPAAQSFNILVERYGTTVERIMNSDKETKRIVAEAYARMNAGYVVDLSGTTPAFEEVDPVPYLERQRTVELLNGDDVAIKAVQQDSVGYKWIFNTNSVNVPGMSELFNKDISEGRRSYTTINDIIANPEKYLSEKHVKAIKDKYNRINSYVTYNYLNEYFINKTDSEYAVTQLDDGTCVFVQYRNKDNILSKHTLSKSPTANTLSMELARHPDGVLLSKYISDDLIVGLAEKTKVKAIVLTDEQYKNSPEQGSYDAGTNTLTIYMRSTGLANSLFRYILLHEFQHVVQNQNHYVGGLSLVANFAPSIELMADILEHYPGVLPAEFKLKDYATMSMDNQQKINNIVRDFIYTLSGELYAYGQSAVAKEVTPLLLNRKGDKLTITMPHGTSYTVDANGNVTSSIRKMIDKVDAFFNWADYQDYCKYYDRIVNGDIDDLPDMDVPMLYHPEYRDFELMSPSKSVWEMAYNKCKDTGYAEIRVSTVKLSELTKHDDVDITEEDEAITGEVIVSEHGEVLYSAPRTDLYMKLRGGAFKIEDLIEPFSPAFYSQLERTILDSPQNKFSASQVVPFLKGKGITALELKWFDLENWLEDKKSVTKDELLEYLRLNCLDIEESYRHGKWDKYTVSSKYAWTMPQHYTEYLFKLPPKSGESYINSAMSTHWAQPNVLAHARTEEIYDMDDHERIHGRYLFIDEIQSDWHNAGRTRGYMDTEKILELENKLTDIDSAIDSVQSSIISRLKDTVKFLEGVPYAVLKEAFDNAQRITNIYHISKSDDFILDLRIKINHNTLPNPYECSLLDSIIREFAKKQYASVQFNDANFLRSLHYSLYPYKHEREKLEAERNKLKKMAPVTAFDSDTYSDYVLKVLLRKAAEEDLDGIAWTTASVQATRWGEKFFEGYKNVYDRNFVKFLNKYGKQWGAQVDKKTFNILENAGPQWYFPLTEQMKDDILYQGQPTFGSATIARKTVKTPNNALTMSMAKIDDTKLDQNIAQAYLDRYKSFTSTRFFPIFDEWNAYLKGTQPKNFREMIVPVIVSLDSFIGPTSTIMYTPEFSKYTEKFGSSFVLTPMKFSDYYGDQFDIKDVIKNGIKLELPVDFGYKDVKDLRNHYNTLVNKMAGTKVGKFYTSKDMRTLADKVFDVAERTNMWYNISHEEIDSSVPDAVGIYTPSSHRVALLPRVYEAADIDAGLNIVDWGAYVILHETIHSATYTAIWFAMNKDKIHLKLSPSDFAIYNDVIQAGLGLINIYKELKSNHATTLSTNGVKDYGLTDVYEMVAELATSTFVKKLKKISIWDKIVDLICKLFGFTRKNTAYNRIYQLVDKIVSTPPEFTNKMIEALRKFATSNVAPSRKMSMSKIEDDIEVEPPRKPVKRVTSRGPRRALRKADYEGNLQYYDTRNKLIKGIENTTKGYLMRLSEGAIQFIQNSDLDKLNAEVAEAIKKGANEQELYKVLQTLTPTNINDYTFEMANKYLYKNYNIKSRKDLDILLEFAAYIYEAASTKDVNIEIKTALSVEEWRDRAVKLKNELVLAATRKGEDGKIPKEIKDTIKKHKEIEQVFGNIHTGILFHMLMKYYDGEVDTIRTIYKRTVAGSKLGITGTTGFERPIPLDSEDAKEVKSKVLYTVHERNLAEKWSYILSTTVNQNKRKAAEKYGDKPAKVQELASAQRTISYLYNLIVKYGFVSAKEAREHTGITLNSENVRSAMSTYNGAMKLLSNLIGLFKEYTELNEEGDVYSKEVRVMINTEFDKINVVEDFAAVADIPVEKVKIEYNLSNLSEQIRRVVRSIENSINRKMIAKLETFENGKFKGWFDKETVKIDHNLWLEKDGPTRAAVLSDLKQLKKLITSLALLSQDAKTQKDRVDKAKEKREKAEKSAEEARDKVKTLKAEVKDLKGSRKQLDKAITTIDKLNEKLKAQAQANKELKRTIKEYKLKINKGSTSERTITIDSSIEAPTIVKELFDVTFNDYDKTNVKYLSKEDDTHRVISGEAFFEQTASIWDKLITENRISDVKQIIEYLSNSIVYKNSANVNAEDIVAINSVSMLVLGEIYRLHIQNILELPENVVTVLETQLEVMARSAGTTLSTWKNVLERINPTDNFAKVLMKRFNTDVKDEVDNLSKALKTGEMKKITEANEELATKLVKEGSSNETELEKILHKMMVIQRTAMLSNPGTWFRNVASNIMLKYAINPLSDALGKLLSFGRKYRDGQLDLTSEKVTKDSNPNIKKFIKNDLYDSGFMNLICDSLTKFDDITRGKRSLESLSEEERLTRTLAEMIANATSRRISKEFETSFGESKAKNDKLRNINNKVRKGTSKVVQFVYKMNADDAVHIPGKDYRPFDFIGKSFRQYLEQLIVVKKLDISKGVRDPRMMAAIAEAYSLAAYDYMHRRNFLMDLEQNLAKHSKAAYYIYKMTIGPFLSSNINWFNEMLDMSPFGLIRTIAKLAKFEKTIEKLENKLQKGESVQISIELQQMMLRRKLGKGALGTLLSIIGGFLAWLGVIRADEDDYGKLKVVIGDYTYVDVSNLLGSSSLILGAQFVASDGWEKVDFGQVVVDTLNYQFEDFIVTSVINNFKRYDSMEKFLVDYPYTVLNGFIPNILKSVNKMTYNRNIKYASGTVMKDIWGNVQRLGVNLIGPIAYAMPTEIDPYTGKIDYQYATDFGAIEPILYDLSQTILPVNFKKYGMSDAEKIARQYGINKQELRGYYEDIGRLDVNTLNTKYGELNNNDIMNFVNNKVMYTVEVELKNGRTVRKTLYYKDMTTEQRKSVLNRITSQNAEIAKIYAWTSAGHKYYCSKDKRNMLTKYGIKNVFIGDKGFVK